MTNKLSNKIMRRVYFAYLMKRALHPLMMKVYVLSLALVAVTVFTSLPHVFANMPFDPQNLVTFSTYAFMHTDLIVQLAVLSGIAAMLWLLSDLVRSGTHAPQHAL